MVEEIADIADPRLDDYRNVPDPELLASRGIFIAEGRLVVRRLLTASRFAARSLLLTPAAQRALADLIAAHPALRVFVVDQHAMNAVVGYNIHRGCLAVGERAAAESLFSWVSRLRAPDGAYFTGHVAPDGSTFPAGERSTYSSAAVVLAADALAGGWMFTDVAVPVA